MISFPYTAVPKRLLELLDQTKKLGIPEKADAKWLKQIGYEGNNDASMLRVLQLVGFIDDTKSPTDRWEQYRINTNAAHILATGIQEGYAELYKVYPQAHLAAEAALTSFFKTHSKAGEQSISRTVKTFQALCSVADFNGAFGEDASMSSNGSKQFEEENTGIAEAPTDSGPNTPALHIDINVHIAADAPESQIDQIFESMAKHLYSKQAD